MVLFFLTKNERFIVEMSLFMGVQLRLPVILILMPLFLMTVVNMKPVLDVMECQIVH